MNAKSVNILIVDDDIAWQQILTEILSEMGHNVDVAQSYDTAEVLLRTRPHRLAIVDLSLGEYDHNNRDGLRVLEAARKYNPNCSTILLSGFATVEVAVRAMKDHQAYTCLRKDEFKRANFRKVINDALAITLPENNISSLTAVQPNGSEVAGSAEELISARITERALLVEDDAGWRELLGELLDEAGYTIKASQSFVDAIGHLKREGFQLAVIDLSLASSMDEENQDGYKLLEYTKKAGIPTIVVSGYAIPERIEAAYEDQSLFACLEKQSFERRFFRQTLRDIRTANADTNILRVLTRREIEVLELLVDGMTNKEIADALFVTHNTVKRHLKSIFSKLEVNTRAAAVSKAMHAGMTGSASS
jgi:DNA-binding NarL/FixJ family response regulator